VHHHYLHPQMTVDLADYIILAGDHLIRAFAGSTTRTDLQIMQLGGHSGLILLIATLQMLMGIMINDMQLVHRVCHVQHNLLLVWRSPKSSGNLTRARCANSAWQPMWVTIATHCSPGFGAELQPISHHRQVVSTIALQHCGLHNHCDQPWPQTMEHYPGHDLPKNNFTATLLVLVPITPMYSSCSFSNSCWMTSRLCHVTSTSQSVTCISLVNSSWRFWASSLSTAIHTSTNCLSSLVCPLFFFLEFTLGSLCHSLCFSVVLEFFLSSAYGNFP
jgi:hypothetical protein